MKQIEGNTVLLRKKAGINAGSAEVPLAAESAVSLGIAGLLFILYPVIRPFSDEATLQGAAAFASSAWLVSHSLAILGFILMTAGLVGFGFLFRGTAYERLALYSCVAIGVGVGLVLPFYGAEVFGLHAIGMEAVQQNQAELIRLADQVRLGPGLAFILAGLLLTAAGTVLLAAIIWKSGSINKWSGIPLAAGFLLYIPQFGAPQSIRVLHGLLVAAGCLWLAAGLWGHKQKMKS